MKNYLQPNQDTMLHRVDMATIDVAFVQIPIKSSSVDASRAVLVGSNEVGTNTLLAKPRSLIEILVVFGLGSGYVQQVLKFFLNSTELRRLCP